MRDRLIKIIVEQLCVDEKLVTNEASFKDDLKADSLDRVELHMAYEEEFSIQITDAHSEKFITVQDVLDYLKSIRLKLTNHNFDNHGFSPVDRFYTEEHGDLILSAEAIDFELRTIKIRGTWERACDVELKVK